MAEGMVTVSRQRVYPAIAALFIRLSPIWLCVGCANQLFYYPTRISYSTPDAREQAYEDVYFASRDGTLLHGWFVPASGDPQGTVIYFHGNAQNITAHFWFVNWLPEAGFNLFAFDYRGYGLSEGEPSRRGIYEDSVAAIGYVENRPDVDPERLVLFGQSLGGAQAIAAIGRGDTRRVKAVAVESTFYSYRAAVRDRLRKIPLVGLLNLPLSFFVVSNRFSPGAVVDHVAPTPLLVIHGTDDRIVPYEHALRLVAKAKEPKTLWTIDKGFHASAFVRRPKNRARLIRFFKGALDGSE